MKAGGAVVEGAQWVADSADLVNMSELHQKEGLRKRPAEWGGPHTEGLTPQEKLETSGMTAFIKNFVG